MSADLNPNATPFCPKTPEPSAPPSPRAPLTPHDPVAIETAMAPPLNLPPFYFMNGQAFVPYLSEAGVLMLMPASYFNPWQHALPVLS